MRCFSSMQRSPMSTAVSSPRATCPNSRIFARGRVARMASRTGPAPTAATMAASAPRPRSAPDRPRACPRSSGRRRARRRASSRRARRPGTGSAATTTAPSRIASCWRMRPIEPTPATRTTLVLVEVEQADAPQARVDRLEEDRLLERHVARDLDEVVDELPRHPDELGVAAGDGVLARDAAACRAHDDAVADAPPVDVGAAAGDRAGDLAAEHAPERLRGRPGRA